MSGWQGRAAVDGQGQFATVAVLGTASLRLTSAGATRSATRPMLWRRPLGGHRYAAADLSAAHPWVAYQANEGHAPQLSQTLDDNCTSRCPDLPVSAPPSSVPPASAPPARPRLPPHPPDAAPPVSGVPQQVSGPPKSAAVAPESGAPMPRQLPWAMHMAPVSGSRRLGSPQPVSASPASPLTVTLPHSRTLPPLPQRSRPSIRSPPPVAGGSLRWPRSPNGPTGS